MTDTPSNLMLLLGRIDGKLDSALNRIEQQSDTLDKHDARISKLEQNKAWVLGVTAAVSTGIGVLFKFGLPFFDKGTQ